MLKFVENLLRGAPVEWKKLGEICDFRHGFSFKASLFKKVGDPVIRIMNIHDDRVTLENLAYFDRTDYTTDLAPWRVQKGDILIAMSGATTGKIGFVDDDIPAYINQRVGKFIPNRACLNNRYLFYFLANEMQTIYEMAHGGAQPNLSSSALLDNLLIPLPPLHVQEKIVAVLDKFTALERELKTKLGTEFVLRRKQYEYYRNKLLTFGEEVEWKTLGEVFETRNGYTPSKKEEKYWRGGTIPWFRMEDLRTSGTLLSTAIQRITPEAIRGKGLFRANSLIMATTATIGEHALLLVDALANQQFTNFRIRETYEKCLLPKFAYYYFYILDAWCLDNTYVGSFPSVDVEKLKLQKFPLPPLHVQEKIVEILDKFNTLANSLTEGLPREIALRHKQYEYYRDALLTFPKAT